MLQSLEHSSDEHLRDSLDMGRSFSLSGINIKSYCTDLNQFLEENSNHRCRLRVK